MVKSGESGLGISFDNKTKEKVNGRTRYLLVDGHNSHYTVGFLLYACEHNIEILCHPSHRTHIYQGLDVIVFSQLKKCWQEEKSNFHLSMLVEACGP